MWISGGTFNANEILQFLEDNKFPLVSVLTELNSAKLFSSASKLQVPIISQCNASSFISLIIICIYSYTKA